MSDLRAYKTELTPRDAAKLSAKLEMEGAPLQAGTEVLIVEGQAERVQNVGAQLGWTMLSRSYNPAPEFGAISEYAISIHVPGQTPEPGTEAAGLLAELQNQALASQQAELDRIPIATALRYLLDRTHSAEMRM